jgi:hypothetical protein
MGGPRQVRYGVGRVTGPYLSGSRPYHAAGYGPLPLPPRRKKEPPKGGTGREAPMPSAADVMAWCEDHPNGNIALRLPRGVIGIDVDAYKGPAELAAWLALVERLGPLPETAPWCTSPGPARSPGAATTAQRARARARRSPNRTGRLPPAPRGRRHD